MTKNKSVCKNIIFRFVFIMLSACIMFSAITFLPVKAVDATGISYIIYESDTKQTLEKQNIDAAADCSLLSRLMTCLLIYENPAVSVTDYVTPSEDSISVSGRYSLFATNQYQTSEQFEGSTKPLLKNDQSEAIYHKLQGALPTEPFE